MTLPVLIYHHIGPLPPGMHPSLTVPSARFERQIRWLARRGFSGISSADWLEWLRERRSLPPRPVLITFDDGYADLTNFALPLLREYGFRATVFLVSGQIGGTNTWDPLEGSSRKPLLSADEILEWRNADIEFGAHGRTHADLTRAETDVLAEVAGSAADLKNLLGEQTVSFAYPWGLVNETVRACVARSFELGFTTCEGLNDARTDRYLVRRTMVQPHDSQFDFRCRVTLGRSPIDPVRRAVRLRSRMRAARDRLIAGRAGTG